jgi:hypothetical protein
MTSEKALQVLVRVALLAQSKGILSLDDAAVVRDAINFFNKPQDTETNGIEENVEQPTE